MLSAPCSRRHALHRRQRLEVVAAKLGQRPMQARMWFAQDGLARLTRCDGWRRFVRILLSTLATVNLQRTGRRCG